MVNLVFEIANVFKLFETHHVYFKAPSGLRGRGVVQVGRGRMEDGEQVCAPEQSPALQPKAEIFAFQ